MDEITKPMMKKLVAKLVDQGLARDTIRLIVASLGIVYSQAIDDKITKENPTRGMGKFYRQAKMRQEEINPLTEEESLLFQEKTLEYERKHYPLFLCALHTGMRSGGQSAAALVSCLLVDASFQGVWDGPRFLHAFLAVPLQIARLARSIPH